MKITNYKYLPTLDLHGEIASRAILLVNDFLLEQYMLGNTKVVIIHGIGSGILRKTVHEVLSTNKLVLNYKLDMYNIGMTIVELHKTNT
jgi:DNA mismatch repair protein MutS2